MNHLRKTVYFLMGIFLGMPLWGAETPKVLTWPDCVQIAAQRNPDLLSAARAMEASRAGYKGSYNGIFPHLALTHSYTDSKGATSDTESTLWQAQGTASLDLINVNQWASIQSASASLRQSEAVRQVASSTVLLNLYKAFAGVLYNQELIGVATHIRDLWNNNNQLINLRYASGRESKGNRMRTQSELLQAESALRQAGRDLRVSQTQLAQSLGQEAFSALAVTGTWTAEQLADTVPDLESKVGSLPTVRAGQAAVELAQAAVNAARSPLLPILSLNYSRGVQGSTEFPSSPYWAFTGLVNYPLFGSGPTATYFASVAASRTLEKAKLDLQSIRYQARTDLESAWSDLAQAHDQVKVQRSFLNAATQRKEESDIRYQSGLMTFQDWELVTNDYVNSQRSFLSAEQNLILAEAQWRFASGEQL